MANVLLFVHSHRNILMDSIMDLESRYDKFKFVKLDKLEFSNGKYIKVKLL